MASSKVLIASALVIAAMLQCAMAVSHTVGGSTGWMVPSGGAQFYENWANGQNFSVGDTLVFNFVTGAHDVVQVREANYGGCNGTNPISTTTTGPANIVLNTTGDHYFICTIPGHCSAGQKVTINVSGSTAGSPASPPTAGSPPSPPTAGSPDSPPTAGSPNSPPTAGGDPSANSASSLAAGFRVAGLSLGIASAISFLF